jgi:hypothetical protein
MKAAVRTRNDAHRQVDVESGTCYRVAWISSESTSLRRPELMLT